MQKPIKKTLVKELRGENSSLVLNQPKCDVLILTALGIERQAVIAYLSTTQEIVHLWEPFINKDIFMTETVLGE